MLWARDADSVVDLTSYKRTLIMWDTPNKARSHNKAKVSKSSGK